LLQALFDTLPRSEGGLKAPPTTCSTEQSPDASLLYKSSLLGISLLLELTAELSTTVCSTCVEAVEGVEAREYAGEVDTEVGDKAKPSEDNSY
jgi:hypothetical protein